MNKLNQINNVRPKIPEVVPNGFGIDVAIPPVPPTPPKNN